MAVLALFGENPWCCTYGPGDTEFLWSYDMMVTTLVVYIVVQCGIRGLCPTGIRSSYLGGISAVLFLAGCHAASGLFDKARGDRQVTTTLGGFEKRYDNNHPRATRKKLAFGADFSRKSWNLLRGSFAFYMQRFKHGKDVGDHSTRMILARRLYMGTNTGIYGLFRRSEYLFSRSDKTRPVNYADFWLFDAEGHRIPFSQVATTPCHTLKIVVPFAKNDQSGWSRVTTHVRVKTPDDHPCFVQQVEEYISGARNVGALESDSFLSLPGFGQLPVEDLEAFMNLAIDDWYAREAPSSVKKWATSHSLRYGGATMMAAAGMPEYLIEYFGGWAPGSTSKRRYTQISEEMVVRVSEALARAASAPTSRFFMQETAMAMDATMKK